MCKTSLVNRVLGVLACLRAYRARVLRCLGVCMLAWRTRVLTCLLPKHAYFFDVLTCSHVLHACCAQISYVFMCLCAWYPCLLYLLQIWKVQYQIFLYRRLWFLSRDVFTTNLNVCDGVFLRKKLTPRGR